MLRSTLSILLTLLAAPALAAATAEQELAPGVAARLIAAPGGANGTTYAALELNLPAGTHTYWRIPGESGIPTQIDLAGSTGIAEADIQWPVPHVELGEAGPSYVYNDHLVIPIRLQHSAADGVIEAAVTLGLCSDVCVPAQAKFSLPVSFGAADEPQSIRIDTALAQTPIAWDQPGDPVPSVVVSPDGAALNIHSPDSSIDPSSFIADVGDPSVLFAAPQKSPDGTLWTLKLLGESGTKGLVGRPVQLTFTTPNGPYAVTRTIGPAS
jgi:DsbC/DsbD-like thiol-disulfide interchange protein